MMVYSKKQGFTLVELVVVVAMVGILAAIAIPNYQDSVRKSRRKDAEGALVGFANAMERYFTEHNSYKSAATGGADTGFPPVTLYSNQSPVDGGTKYYDLKINAADVTTYTLEATPAGAQANDSCGILTVDNTGVRTAKKNNVSVPNCW
jgi:type IV pilus assembly protein PilE